MSFSRVCITLVLSTAAVSMQAAEPGNPTIPAPAHASATSDSSLRPASFACYIYPESMHVQSSLRGMVCPTLQPGDGTAKPGWSKEFRCSISGATASCDAVERSGPISLASADAPGTYPFWV